jgi:hypothetical protein
MKKGKSVGKCDLAIGIRGRRGIDSRVFPDWLLQPPREPSTGYDSATQRRITCCEHPHINTGRRDGRYHSLSVRHTISSQCTPVPLLIAVQDWRYVHETAVLRKEMPDIQRICA